MRGELEYNFKEKTGTDTAPQFGEQNFAYPLSEASNEAAAISPEPNFQHEELEPIVPVGKSVAGQATQPEVENGSEYPATMGIAAGGSADKTEYSPDERLQKE